MNKNEIEELKTTWWENMGKRENWTWEVYYYQ